MSESVTEFDDMQAIVEEFLVESEELIGKLDADLVKLEKEPEDLDLLNEIFRSAHTIKGTSGFLGFDDLMSFTHAMEDVLNRLRKDELKVEPEVMDVLLESVDILKTMVDDIKEGRDNSADFEPVEKKLRTIEKGEQSSSESEPEKKKSTEKSHAEKQNNISQTTQGKSTPVSKKNLKEKFDKKKFEKTIRVDVSRLDNLMNMMGELVLGRNSLMQVTSKINLKWEGEELTESLSQSANQINFITTELQMAVMKMRMLPIGNAFNKFPRLVRDLSREMKKKIELKISGEDTELDKTVIEEIGDPLVHLIRNSCDHGIESPEERISNGKPETGTVWLKADQEGSNIVIEVSDDGGGVDTKKVAKKAIEKGLISKQDVASMSDREIMQFIFAPGFSTAQKVTDVSGRGVGMDVVRTNIEKLGGIIEIDSELNAGTKIRIKLPLTLAIIQGLLVKSDNEVLIIPLASVLETVKIKDHEIYYLNKQEVIKLRDNVLPILDLNRILGLPEMAEESKHKPYIVIVGLAEKSIGLLVDELLGQEEVVIKTLGQYLGNTTGLSGATILGDGRIRLIVDVQGLFNIVETN